MMNPFPKSILLHRRMEANSSRCSLASSLLYLSCYTGGWKQTPLVASLPLLCYIYPATPADGSKLLSLLPCLFLVISILLHRRMEANSSRCSLASSLLYLSCYTGGWKQTPLVAPLPLLGYIYPATPADGSKLLSLLPCLFFVISILLHRRMEANSSRCSLASSLLYLSCYTGGWKQTPLVAPLPLLCYIYPATPADGSKLLSLLPCLFFVISILLHRRMEANSSRCFLASSLLYLSCYTGGWKQTPLVAPLPLLCYIYPATPADGSKLLSLLPCLFLVISILLHRRMEANSSRCFLASSLLYLSCYTGGWKQTPLVAPLPLLCYIYPATPADGSKLLSLLPCLFLVMLQDAHVPNF